MLEWEAFLNELYFTPSRPGAFSGPKKLQQILHDNGHNVTLKAVKQWVQNQDSYSLLRPVKYKFKRRRIVTTGVDGLWDADLADVTNLKEHNDGISYLLVVIDVFSRFLWVEPIPSKQKNVVKAAFNRIFQRTDRQPQRLRTDNGTEFKNKEIKRLMKSKDIKHFTTHNETKANYAERVIRTLKGLMYRYFIHKQTYRYLDVLQDLVMNYNNRPHKSIFNKKPAAVNANNEALLWKRLYVDTAARARKHPFIFSVGDQVRISHLQYPFQRDYQQKWTEEHFIVAHRLKRGNHNLYQLKDITNEPIDGNFYEPELQKIRKDNDATYRIEKIIKSKKVGGKKQYLVKWSGWRPKFNSWITEADLKNY